MYDRGGSPLSFCHYACFCLRNLSYFMLRCLCTMNFDGSCYNEFISI